jgi:CubicO group peptidase (beta-lactamase class C family)
MKKSSLFLFSSFLLISAGGLFAESSLPKTTRNNGIDTALAQGIQEFVMENMEKDHSPGIGVGIVKGTRLVYAGYFGYADIEEKKPVGEDTMFRIGSISKTFTAIGLMQQWEKGKFDIDDNINQYFPEPLIFPPHPEANPVTFRHLLTHTSGGGEFLSYKQAVTPGFGVYIKEDEYPPLADLLKLGLHNRLDPGVKWAYCNYGFAFLGHALESIAGQPFHIYMEENVLEPLGMEKTSYHHDDEILANLSTGYKWSKDEYVEDPHKPIPITPAGSIYTNVPEMSRYVIALLNGGRNEHGAVIRPDTLEMMFETQYTLDERQSGWGLGFAVYSNNVWGHRVIGHSGSVPWGHTSNMLLCPEDRIGVYAFSNSGTYAPKDIGWGILKMVLGVKDEPLPKVAPDKQVWENLEGIYGVEYRDFKTSTRLYMGGIGAYRVRIIDDELKLISLWHGKKESKTLAQVGLDDPYFFQVIDEDNVQPHYIAFRTGDSGKAEYIIPGGLNRYKRLPPARRIRVMIFAVPGRILNEFIPF